MSYNGSCSILNEMKMVSISTNRQLVWWGKVVWAVPLNCYAGKLGTFTYNECSRIKTAYNTFFIFVPGLFYITILRVRAWWMFQFQPFRSVLSWVCVLSNPYVHVLAFVSFVFCFCLVRFNHPVYNSLPLSYIGHLVLLLPKVCFYYLAFQSFDIEFT